MTSPLVLPCMGWVEAGEDGAFAPKISPRMSNLGLGISTGWSTTFASNVTSHPLILPRGTKTVPLETGDGKDKSSRD
eukprot:6321453-Amphidinium_carterae.1